MSRSPAVSPLARAGEPQREVLENGIVLLWIRSEDAPSVSLRASFSAGAFRETPGEEGLASFVSRLLRRGSVRSSAQELSARVEDLGASFGVWAGSEEAGFSAKCLGRDLLPVLETLREVLEEPAFAEAEIERVRGDVLTDLDEQEDSPRARADLALYEMLYPAGHPYSRSTLGTRETVRAIGAEDLHLFHHRFYSASAMIVSVVGPIDVDAVRGHLKEWLPGKPTPEIPNDLRVTPSARAGREVISLPHKSQVSLRIGGPGIPRAHPDYFPLSLVNLILGSLGLMGRLGERVRDEHGMAYSVSCRSQSRLWSGEWIAGAGVSPGNEDRALELILEEVRRVREDLVTERELADAQSNLIGSLPLRMETHDGLAAYLLSTEYYGLGLDYLDRYPDLVRGVTREAMREAARAHMDPAGFSVSVAGPV